MAPPSQRDLLAGRYRRLGSLGVGGMARVHVAEDERLGRRVAIKQLHATGPADAALRFEREAKLGASLNHPNLVSIYDIAADDESVLIVMELVEGETLQAAIGRGPLPPARVVAVVRDVAAGLDHAHAHGVVHRDVKPANVLLRDSDGVAKLADLGIATAAERTAITRSDVVLGTASYMAPEQLAGERAGPAADVYALAAVAYEALAGEKARAGKTPVEVAHEIVNAPPPDLRAAWTDAPPAAAAALARGMAREPERRPRSAGALADELEHALGERSATTATAPLAPRHAATVERGATRRSPARGPSRSRGGPDRRGGWIAAAAALLLTAAVALGAIGLSGEDGGDDGSVRQAGPAQSRGGADGGRRASGDGQRSDGGAGRADVPAPPEPAPDPEPQPAGDPVALNDQGYALMQAGDYERAIPLLEQAVAAFPDGSRELTYAYALYNLGRSLRLAGRPAEAVPVLERRLTIPNQTGTVRRELEAARQAG
jgi:tetratricopeptide (TPR) repeat protein